MQIHPDVYKSCHLSEQQEAILQHDDGPLLIVAGPGSGKTSTLLLRVLNVLLNERAEPAQLVLCTYTEKAAQELFQKLIMLAKKIGYQGNLAEMRIGTVHALCNHFVREYLHDDVLGNDYEVLDEFEQRLFIYHHLNELAPESVLHYFGEEWGKEWYIAKWLQQYFNTIMEELVDLKGVCATEDPLLRQIGIAYKRYRAVLRRENKVSFSAQLRLAYNLLTDAVIAPRIIKQIRYVFVDEYQDTNSLQAQILRKMAVATDNICVVGDDDQAIYRFRGATVRNILEFDKNFPQCITLPLTINYRSHKGIVERYNAWMKTGKWSVKGASRFRKKKEIVPEQADKHEEYPSVVKIEGKDDCDEAKQVAQCIQFLKEQGIISDYNQVALLLYSVKSQFSNCYVGALNAQGIPSFCPRARSYFEREEVCLLMACFAVLLHYSGKEQEQEEQEQQDFARYIRDQCLQLLHEPYSVLQDTLYDWMAEQQIRQDVFHTDEKEGELPESSLIHYFYRLLAVEPFVTFLKDEKRMRNLMLFSKKLQTFQTFYCLAEVNETTINTIRTCFFTTFYRLLKDEGVNEYEDIEHAFPVGHVSIMTIHQAKGLEFPVVIVGGLKDGRGDLDKVVHNLKGFYQQDDTNFEPEALVPDFDLMRLYYVAFSRAEKILVLTSNRCKKPSMQFEPMLRGLPCWSEVSTQWIAAFALRRKELLNIKHRYSFTSDIQRYETCPRQYQYFREYEFAEGRQGEFLLGLLVHQTLEELHRLTRNGQVASLNKSMIEKMVQRNYFRLKRRYMEEEGLAVEERAFTQVYNYFNQNMQEMYLVLEVEKELLFERANYLLAGRIDLLRNNRGVLELVDFKTEPKPRENSVRLLDYKRQLCTYAYVLEQRYKQRPDRLLLYWTQEPLREDALMEIPYQPALVERVEQSFAQIVQKIHQQDFQILTVPDEHICQHCHLLAYCQQDGVFAQCARG